MAPYGRRIPHMNLPLGSSPRYLYPLYPMIRYFRGVALENPQTLNTSEKSISLPHDNSGKLSGQSNSNDARLSFFFLRIQFSVQEFFLLSEPDIPNLVFLYPSTNRLRYMSLRYQSFTMLNLSLLTLASESLTLHLFLCQLGLTVGQGRGDLVT